MTTFDHPTPRRKRLRLKDYDYSQAGAYFITACTDKRECVFGQVANDEMVLNEPGRIVGQSWLEVGQHFPDVELDQYVVMPNHLHAILFIRGRSVLDLNEMTATLGVVVGSFKAAATRLINAQRATPGAQVWQRSYHDRVVRDQDELQRIRQYIVENPLRWSLDHENPQRQIDQRYEREWGWLARSVGAGHAQPLRGTGPPNVRPPHAQPDDAQPDDARPAVRPPLARPAVGARHAPPLEHLDKTHLWHPFTQQQQWEAEPQIIIERAEGSYLIDIQGRRYLDGISSLWVNLHGHRRPEIDQAIQAQLEKVAHTTFLGLTHPPGIELARRLVELAPNALSRVFYSDTGAAAVEIALKMAFQYWQQCDPPRPRKTRFFSLHNAYHGDTLGALGVGGIELFQQIYRPTLVPSFKAHSAYCYRCHLGERYPACRIACLEEVEQTISQHADELAAVIMEPLVQGAAGLLVFPPGYTRSVWEIARRYEVLFIADEVATGFGRTGKMFACEHEGVEPDLMALGKGISGGYLPLAATLATEDVYRAFLGRPEQARTFYHGHTYTGNPLACAAAVASLDLFEADRTLERLQPKIALLTNSLEDLKPLPIVGDIRQCGFMVGIELVEDRETRAPFPAEIRPAVRVIEEARRRGVMLRPLGEVLVLMPPLSISDHELELLLHVVRDSISAVAEALA